VAVAVGFDDVLHPYSLIPSLVVGIIGFVVSIWFYLRVLRSGNPSAETWRRRLSGESIASAYLALEEIENANIR
jgi:serine/threonine-protein kinase